MKQYCNCLFLGPWSSTVTVSSWDHETVLFFKTQRCPFWPSSEWQKLFQLFSPKRLHMNSSVLLPVSYFCRSVNCYFSERIVQNQRWSPCPLIDRDILNLFPSRTTAFEITRVARNVPLGVLKKCCYFSKWIDLRWPPWLVIGQDIFYFFSIYFKFNMAVLDFY